MNHDDPELVWQGRLHLGDGPGVYGDAPYVGLSVELPLTVRRFPDAEGSATGALLIETEGLHARFGPTNPTIIVARHSRGGAGGTFENHVLSEESLTEAITTLQIELDGDYGNDDQLPISVLLRTNTDAQPGLYTDFVLVAVRFECATHYASLGFHAAL